jgi:multicomponent Na+:H+ antiporter subunit B
MPRPRALVFFALVLALLPFLLRGLAQLPALGHYRGPYGDAVNALGEPLRHVTNMVSAVNYDFRALDTLGEELILFVAANGIVILLRGARGHGTSARAAHILHRRREGRSEAQTAGGRLLAGVILLYGLYVILHAQLTPGGGFQGGTIVFAAALMLYFGEGYAAWRQLIRSPLLARVEAFGVGLYLLAGLLPMAVGARFLENILPLGQTGSLLSGGLIPVVNLGVGLAVAAGFCSIALELLEETRESGGEAA